MKSTQKQFVIDQLNKTGKISRNFCLNNYITRLGAIVCHLNKKEGWNLEGYWKEGDYIYSKIDASDEQDLKTELSMSETSTGLETPNRGQELKGGDKMRPTTDDLKALLEKQRQDRFRAGDKLST
jgi:hypothetical protein